MLWPEGLDGLDTVTAPTTPKTYCSERGLRSYWLKASCMTAFLTYTEAGLQTPFYLTSLDFVVVKLKHYTLWDERVFHCHSVVHSPLQNTLLKSNPWLARKSILELCEMKWQKTMFHFHFPPKKKKKTNNNNQQTNITAAKIWSLSKVNDQRYRGGLTWQMNFMSGDVLLNGFGKI